MSYPPVNLVVEDQHEYHDKRLVNGALRTIKKNVLNSKKHGKKKDKEDKEDKDKDKQKPAPPASASLRPARNGIDRYRTLQHDTSDLLTLSNALSLTQDGLSPLAGSQPGASPPFQEVAQGCSPGRREEDRCQQGEGRLAGDNEARSRWVAVRAKSTARRDSRLTRRAALKGLRMPIFPIITIVVLEIVRCRSEKITAGYNCDEQMTRRRTKITGTSRRPLTMT